MSPYFAEMDNKVYATMVNCGGVPVRVIESERAPTMAVGDSSRQAAQLT